MSFSLADLSNVLLAWLLIYGAWAILLILFVAALGVPIPGTLVVLAAGAFIRQEVLNLEWVLICALLGLCLGDIACFSIGYSAHKFVRRRLQTSPAWQRAEKQLTRRGGVAIYLTRWLITPLAGPVNLVAGSTGYPFSSFVLFSVSGELTWLLLYGGLGYVFSDQWALINTLISNFSGVLVGVVALAVGSYALLRRHRYQANLKELGPQFASDK